MTEGKRIFLNVVATYGRSLYALVIGLFCGRWALMALGKSDYGILGVVGGLTVFVAYLNGVFGGAVSRFYAITVGKEKTSPEQALAECRMWFTTAVIVHTLIPLVLMLIGYPIGEYAVRHWLVMPADRIESAVWVWRFASVTCFLSMVSVPMNAMYEAKQRIAELTVYAFVTSTLNAVFLYYMITHPGFWLTRLAFWQCLLAVLPSLIIALRAFRLFPECRFEWQYVNCMGNVRKLAGYAAWTALGAFGTVTRDSGSAVLLNLNFGPTVNAGATIGNTLSAQCNTLSGSMIGAVAPAIYNAWGAGLYDHARALAYRTCKIGTLLVLVFAIPLCLEVDEVLRIWLREPPQYASGFCILVLVMNVFDKLSFGHSLAVHANGRVAIFQKVLGTALVMTLPLAWLLIRMGVGPYATGFAMIMTMAFCSLGSVWLARSLVGMSAGYWLKRIAGPIAFVVLVSAAAGCLVRYTMDPSFSRICLTTFLVESVLLSMAWRWVLEPEERDYVVSKVRSAVGGGR